MRMASKLLVQIRTVQREEGGMSKLAAQHNTEPRVTPPTFPKNTPRKDTGSRDKESDQRINQGAWVEADFVKVLDKINAASEGARVITSDTSKANFQGAFCGKGLIDVDV